MSVYILKQRKQKHRDGKSLSRHCVGRETVLRCIFSVLVMVLNPDVLVLQF